MIKIKSCLDNMFNGIVNSLLTIHRLDHFIYLNKQY